MSARRIALVGAVLFLAGVVPTRSWAYPDGLPPSSGEQRDLGDRAVRGALEAARLARLPALRQRLLPEMAAGVAHAFNEAIDFYRGRYALSPEELAADEERFHGTQTVDCRVEASDDTSFDPDESFCQGGYLSQIRRARVLPAPREERLAKEIAALEGYVHGIESEGLREEEYQSSLIRSELAIRGGELARERREHRRLVACVRRYPAGREFMLCHAVVGEEIAAGRHVTAEEVLRANGY